MLYHFDALVDLLTELDCKSVALCWLDVSGNSDIGQVALAVRLHVLHSRKVQSGVVFEVTFELYSVVARTYPGGLSAVEPFSLPVQSWVL